MTQWKKGISGQQEEGIVNPGAGEDDAIALGSASKQAVASLSSHEDASSVLMSSRSGRGSGGPRNRSPVLSPFGERGSQAANLFPSRVYEFLFPVHDTSFLKWPMFA
jgi:hypothetical protein